MNNNGNKLIRVATYARVSTQEQADNGTSLESQSQQLEAFCKAQGWEIFNHYVDPGYSGKDDKRPGLENLRRDAKSGYFQKIVVYKLDRLARNLRILLGIEAELKEHDVSLSSVREMIDMPILLTQNRIGWMYPSLPTFSDSIQPLISWPQSLFH